MKNKFFNTIIKTWKKIKSGWKGILIGFIFGFSIGVWKFYCNSEGCILLSLLPPIISTFSDNLVGYFTGFINDLPNVLDFIIFSLIWSVPYIITGGVIGLIIDKRKKK